MGFQQEDFEYQDLFNENTFLKEILSLYVDGNDYNYILGDLSQFSRKASSELLRLMWQAEKNLPRLIAFDHWGKRIDQIEVDPAWTTLHNVSATEGMVAIGYERKTGSTSRIHQFLKLMLFHPSSAFYTCPLAMTDGAARVLELENGPLKKKYFHNLLSRNGNEFWTAGQWMTEKTGGSDVAQSETYAEEKQGRYFLYGNKWFTSAITANFAMALAQTPVEGKKRLSLFLLQIRDDKGDLNNIEVLRLKDKLGTKAMPTAELELHGTEGFLVGHLGEGVKNISTILNITRLYNSVCATGTIYRLHSLIRDYSKKRWAFGKKLIDHPLHQETLIKTQADTNACVHFVTELASLFGKSEMGVANETEESVLRLMTPVAKLWTGKKAMGTVSELVEAFGGAGYIEDTELPRFLRDAQVFSIWEGTTNIMSLDTLRAISNKKIYFQSMTYIERIFEASKGSINLEKLRKLMSCCTKWLQESQSDIEKMEWGARQLAWSLGDLFVGALILRFANHTKKIRDEHLADVFIGNIEFPQFIQNEGRFERNLETLLS